MFPLSFKPVFYFCRRSPYCEKFSFDQTTFFTDQEQLPCITDVSTVASVDISVDTSVDNRPSIGRYSTEYRRYIERNLVEYRPIALSMLYIGRLSVKSRSILNHVTIDRWSVGRSSIDRYLVEYRSISRVLLY